jgi:hypothetical protein
MMPILGGYPRLRFDSTVAMTFDGNSIVRGAGAPAGFDFPTLLGQLSPFDTVDSITNLGVDGRTTQGMIDAGATCDAAYVSGKTNVLVAWEGVNSINNAGRSAAQAVDDMAAYVAARLAVHPWKVVLVTCLPAPALSGGTNTALDAYNVLLLANWRSMGAAHIVDVRAGAAVALNDGLHPNAAGNYTLADTFAAQLRRMRR